MDVSGFHRGSCRDHIVRLGSSIARSSTSVLDTMICFCRAGVLLHAQIFRGGIFFICSQKNISSQSTVFWMFNHPALLIL